MPSELPNTTRRYRIHFCATRPPLLLRLLLLAAFAFPPFPASAATNDLTSAIQRGLFEEEANQNLGAAIQAYQSVASQFDKDRKLAATAIFRLGECYRKQGNTNEAAACYERILREFSDQPTLVTLSRQNLAGLGTPPAAPAAPVISDAARQEQKRLLEEEIKLVQKQLEMQQKQVQMGVVGPDALWPTEREILKLKRQVAALDAGLPISVTAAEAPATATSTDADEVKRIQALIKDSPDLIKAPDRKGETLLQAAAAKGKLAVVKVLLDSGAAVDGLQQPGLTPLHYAAANGHKTIVDLLLSKGAKPDAQTEDGVTPLQLAARKGYEEVAKALLGAGAPVNAATKRGSSSDTEDLQYSIGAGQTPLHLAVIAGYPGTVELLLAKGADVNAEDSTGDRGRGRRGPGGGFGGGRVDANPEDSKGRTPLSHAVQKGYQAIVQLLLAAHANPNAGSLDLPLAMAAYQGDVPILTLLLANGANPNTNSFLSSGVQTRHGIIGNARFAPLFLAVTQRHPDAAAELLRGKASLNITGPDDNPLLFEALSDASILKVLLEGGADPNVRTSDGTPVLLQAVFDKNQPAVELLLAHHAEVNCTRKQEGWTPLHAAVMQGSKAIAELLLKAGAAVNAKDRNGNTPLHHSVQSTYQELAELLLSNKADPNERNNNGQTPLDLTKQQPGPPGSEQASKSIAMADSLRRHGAADDLPRMDCISLRRPSAGFFRQVFTKGTNDWNQFTLFELIAVQYHFLAASPWGETLPAYQQKNIPQPLPFPDLARLRLRRPGSDPRAWQEQTIDIRRALEITNCAADMRLQWGDVVEIPEADHPLDQPWPGLPAVELQALEKCLARQIQLTVKGQSTNLTLVPNTLFLRSFMGPANQATFWIRPVLRNSGLMLASSDLSRVKVTRRDPATGQERQWVLDCLDGSPAPAFWLRDGDKIEVPEKTE